MLRTYLVVCLLLVQATAPAVAGADGNVPPEAEAGLDQHVDRGATVLLDGGASWDPDGDVADYEWEIRAPNGTSIDPACRTCEESHFVPRRVGTYNVTLGVTDDDGATRTDTMFVVVAPTGGPSVDLTTLRTNGTEGEFRVNASAGDHDLNRLVWRVDGRRVETENVTGGNVIVDRRLELSANGTHNVSVTVVDWLGNRANDTTTVRIGVDGNSPPTISITRAPAALEVGERGRFVASASDPDGGPVTVRWPDVGETNRSIWASFVEEGKETITAIATDDEGDRANDTVNVIVLEDTSGNNDPTVRITHYPSRTLSPGESGTFVAKATDPDGDQVSLSWSNGDAGERTAQSWAGQGTKTVTVTARDGNGGTDTDSVTVEVGRGDGANVSISMVQSPDTLEVGENGTFRARVRVNGQVEAVPVVWEAHAAVGQTATFSFDSPGTKTVSATAVYNDTIKETVTAAVEVVPRSGPVADMRITPKCRENRSQFCGSVTGNIHDPIELSAEPSKEGGGTIETYSWTINGSLASNQEVFERVYAEGPKHVTLTVEDEHGETDTTNRTFYVEAGNDTDVSIELAESISAICPTYTYQCSWDPTARKLTVVRGATTTFHGSVLGASQDTLALQWVTSNLTESDTLKRYGTSQGLTWEDTGRTAIKLLGYQSDSYDQRVAWDGVTVEVVERGNQEPGVTIDDVHEICNEDGTRLDEGCSKTDAVEITYSVRDPDASDEVTVNGFLAPESVHPMANEKVSAAKSTFTTQEIPVTEDGEHNFRVTVTDGQATNQTERAFHIINATGGGDESGGGTVVDGDWTMGIQTRDAGASAKADIKVKCDAKNESTKCPGERVNVNWGDGNQKTLTDDYENGSQTWRPSPHAYTGQGYPTLSIVVLNDQDASVTTMQRYLDLEDAEDYENWKFDEFVKTFGDKPDDHDDSGVWYMDEEDIDEKVGSATWVDSKNHSILNDDWIRSIDTRKTNHEATGNTKWATVAPFCSGECIWSPTGDERKVRGSHISTEWYDDRKSGKRWKKVAEGENVLEEGRWQIVYKDGSTRTAGSCDPTDVGVKKCKKIGVWSGTDYKYKKYRLENENEYEKKTYDKEWKVQKYFQKAYERWVNVG